MAADCQQVQILFTHTQSTNMNPTDQPHFKAIYIFIFTMAVIAFGYLFAVTFYTVPQGNQRVVDIALGSLISGVIIGGIQIISNHVKQNQNLNVGGNVQTNITPDASVAQDKPNTDNGNDSTNQ